MCQASGIHGHGAPASSHPPVRPPGRLEHLGRRVVENNFYCFVLRILKNAYLTSESHSDEFTLSRQSKVGHGFLYEDVWGNPYYNSAQLNQLRCPVLPGPFVPIHTVDEPGRREALLLPCDARNPDAERTFRSRHDTHACDGDLLCKGMAVISWRCWTGFFTSLNISNL